jgi:hypothetical protein
MTYLELLALVVIIGLTWGEIIKIKEIRTKTVIRTDENNTWFKNAIIKNLTRIENNEESIQKNSEEIKELKEDLASGNIVYAVAGEEIKKGQLVKRKKK